MEGRDGSQCQASVAHRYVVRLEQSQELLLLILWDELMHHSVYLYLHFSEMIYY